jgi:vancomycin permeability regulator SanA
MWVARRTLRSWRATTAAIFLATVGVVGPTAWIQRGTRGRSFPDVSLTPSRSVAIVPGAAVSGGRPLRSLSDRLDAALALYRTGRVKAILISGIDTESQPEISVMRQWLAERGVPASDLLVDEEGYRTRATMWNAASRLRVSDAVICTQALYLPRALFLAKKAGIDAVGVALDTPLPVRANVAGVELMKTTLAFAESYLGRELLPLKSAAAPAVLASR